MLLNNGDYGVGTWITDGTLDNRIMCVQTTVAGGSGVGYEFALVSGGTLRFDTVWGTPPDNTWVWWKLEVNWTAGTAKCKVWTGDIGNEPGSWAQEETTTLPTGVNLRILSSATNNAASCKWDDFTEAYVP